MQAARIATGGKDARNASSALGIYGYEVPVARSTTYRLKSYLTNDNDDPVVDEATPMPRAVCSVLKLVLVAT